MGVSGVMANYPGINDTTPQSKGPSGPAPVPAPAAAGLPMWAIILIVIAALLLIIGGGYWFYHSGGSSGMGF